MPDDIKPPEQPPPEPQAERSDGYGIALQTLQGTLTGLRSELSALHDLRSDLTTLAQRVAALESAVEALTRWTADFPDDDGRKVIGALIEGKLDTVVSDIRSLREDLDTRFRGMTSGAEAAIRTLTERVEKLADAMEISADVQTKVTLLHDLQKKMAERLDDGAAFDGQVQALMPVLTQLVDAEKARQKREKKEQEQRKREEKEREARERAREVRNAEIVAWAKPVVLLALTGIWGNFATRLATDLSALWAYAVYASIFVLVVAAGGLYVHQRWRLPAPGARRATDHLPAPVQVEDDRDDGDGEEAAGSGG